MSGDNVEIVRRMLEPMAESGEFSGVFPEGTLAEDVEWHPAEELEAGASYVGQAEFVAFMDRWTEGFEDWSFAIGEIREAGDRVLVSAQQEAVGSGSGARVQMDFWMLIEVRDGLVSDIRAFLDRAKALAAAGLEEPG